MDLGKEVVNLFGSKLQSISGEDCLACTVLFCDVWFVEVVHSFGGFAVFL